LSGSAKFEVRDAGEFIVDGFAGKYGEGVVQIMLEMIIDELG
jgi:hypothetical protein